MDKLRSLFNKTSSSAFQILSDLHLEVGQQYASFSIPPSAPYLILAGDIGRLIDYPSYLSFLVKQTSNFQRVFLVLGNHEFYGTSFEAGLATAQKLEQEPALNGRLTLLHQTKFDVPNTSITILGCTLWSQVVEDCRDMIQLRINDFKRIENWTVDSHNITHKSDVSWLQGQIAKLKTGGEEPARKILIVTHHAPSVEETARPDQVGNSLSSAFATDMFFQSDWANVKAWVFGHTHFTNDFQRDGIRIVSNQRGYVFPGAVEAKIEEKDKKKVYDIRRTIRL